MAVTNQMIIQALQRLEDKMDQKFEQIDSRFERIDERFENVEIMLVGHDNMFKNLLTRDEFNDFKMEHLGMHENLALSLERLEQEFSSFSLAHDRLEGRVDHHEKVLMQNGLMQR
ncbi:hypothetical protein IPG41_01645 [Candidatus Peregrinibacteria bacterium]|nr:MAG: hypothetical protein IPG41_01645 [Candidatus Peregrinibacteria bacterium]